MAALDAAAQGEDRLVLSAQIGHGGEAGPQGLQGEACAVHRLVGGGVRHGHQPGVGVLLACDVDVAVDQAGGEGRAIGVDQGGGVFGVEIGLAAPGGDLAAFSDQAISVEDGLLHAAREHQADVADHQFCGLVGHFGLLIYS